MTFLRLQTSFIPYYLLFSLHFQAPPSHAVIARPHYSLNGGEASVGAALSVSDTGSGSSGESFNQEILALLGQAVRPQESRSQSQQSSTAQSAAPQYQQVRSP